MNSDQIKGSVKDVAGKAQRKVGEAVGSTDQQVKGALTQAEGKAQKAVGNVREAAKEASRKI
ncbi:MAG: CsbD family protein [Rubrivivax sp.]|nr:MAG: CsbD family protein [Rubrivivax sp.]